MNQNSNTKIQTAILAGGCFWCTEALLKDLKGVLKVESGYTGGNVENPSYIQVCNGGTGHAEAIRIEFDSSIITFGELLSIFFNIHDPTTLNRQGNDIGTQYRSEIFYITDEQKSESEELIKELNDKKAYDNPVVTKVTKAGKFYIAEDYHHNYYEQNKDKGYCQLIIAPKLEKLQKKYKSLLQ